MTGIQFVDRRPSFEPSGDNMIITFPSGGGVITLAVPRSVFFETVRRSNKALNGWLESEASAHVLALPKKQRREGGE